MHVPVLALVPVPEHVLVPVPVEPAPAHELNEFGSAFEPQRIGTALSEALRVEIQVLGTKALVSLGNQVLGTKAFEEKDFSDEDWKCHSSNKEGSNDD